MGIHYDALHSGRRLVIVGADSVATVVFRNNYTSAVWIEEHFSGVETHPVLRVHASVYAIPVNLARTHAGYEDMPVVIGAVRRRVNRDHATWKHIGLAVIQQQLDCGRPTGEYAEIDAVRYNRCSERITLPRAVRTVCRG